MIVLDALSVRLYSMLKHQMPVMSVEPKKMRTTWAGAASQMLTGPSKLKITGVRVSNKNWVEHK